MRYLLIILFVVFSFSAQADEKELLTVEQLTRSKTEGGVFQLLEWSKDHTLFVSALRATGLNEELDKIVHGQ